MAIEKTETGSVMITGEEDIGKYRLLVMRRALLFEIDTGMQMTRGQSGSARIKKEFGIKAHSKKNVLKQFEKIMIERGVSFNGND